jgi:hypothetical protein
VATVIIKCNDTENSISPIALRKEVDDLEKRIKDLQDSHSPEDPFGLEDVPLGGKQPSLKSHIIISLKAELATKKRQLNQFSCLEIMTDEELLAHFREQKSQHKKLVKKYWAGRFTSAGCEESLSTALMIEKGLSLGDMEKELTRRGISVPVAEP